TSPDYNSALVITEGPQGLYKRPHYFGSRDDPVQGPLARWDEDWVLAVFPLDHRPGQDEALLCHGQPFVGRTAQFRFGLYTGESDDADPGPGNQPDPLVRGRGQGWFVDSAVVTASNVTAGPTRLHLPLLDNATKSFPLRITNFGAATEHLRVTVDLDRTTLSSDEASAGGELSVEPDRWAQAPVRVGVARDPLALPFGHTVVARAEGTLDPNLRPTMRLQLDFDPRIWPDLEVRLLDPSEPPVEGVPSVLPVQITNHGRARAPPTDLVLRDTFEGRTHEVTAQVPAIASPSADPLAATTIVYLPWTPERSTAGDHRLEVVVDPQQRIEEYLKSDNRLVTTLNVQRLLIPDLVFDEANLTVTSGAGDIQRLVRGTLLTFTATTGTLATLSVPVANVGTATATNVDVRLFLGAVVLPAKRLTRLDPGESADVTFTFIVQEGTFPLSLEATSSSRDLVPEDNHAPLAGALRLLAARFRIEAKLPDQLSAPGPGTLDDVVLTLENRGALGVLIDLVARTGRHVTYLPETTQLFLGAGERVELPGRIELADQADGGTHRVVVEVVDHDAPANSVLAEVLVSLPALHDVTVTTSKTELLPGADVLPVHVVNDGNLGETLDVAVLANERVLGGPLRVQLARGAARTVEVPLVVPSDLPSGPAQITVRLNGSLVQTDVLDLDIVSTARPQLTALAQASAFGPQGLVVPLLVVNVGNEATEGTLALDPSVGAGRGTIRPARISLAPGGHAEAELVVPADALGADAAGILLQLDRGDALSRSVALPTERPDVLVVRHELSPERPFAGETTRMVVTVGNIGQTRARDVPIELFIDEAFAVRGVISEIEPGRTRQVTFEWPAFEGRHVVSAVVDPGSRVPD
ncbi:MAG TPA: CARDB domain-containing protein, partial [Nitriliruptorales bacterium]